MTKREFGRLEIIIGVDEGQLTVNRAAELLSLSRRQVFRLLNRFRSIGPHGLASQKRGLPSNRQIHRAVRQMAIMLVKQYYPDFGPTLATEKLAEQHDCRVSRETLDGEAEVAVGSHCVNSKSIGVVMVFDPVGSMTSTPMPAPAHAVRF
jgi:Winged helix-turn helix